MFHWQIGLFPRILVGLAAVSVERTGTALGEDVPGDEVAGARGIPFRQQEIEDAELAFRFQGPAAPQYPGLPDLRKGPGEGEQCIEPGYNSVIVETNYIGYTSAGGFDYSLTKNWWRLDLQLRREEREGRARRLAPLVREV